MLPLALAVPAGAAVNHSPEWVNATTLTYNLDDLDEFEVGAGVEKVTYGNEMSSISNGTILPYTFGFTRLTLPPYSNASEDLFLATEVSDGVLHRVLFPEDSHWIAPTDSESGSINTADGVPSMALYRYLHFRNDLVDEVPDSPKFLDATTEKVVVLIHGYNPSSSPDSYAFTEFTALKDALRQKLNGTGWSLVLYRWEADADTGIKPDVAELAPIKAAHFSHMHGQHLGELLATTCPKLKSVHFIAHSAGSWAARSASLHLMTYAPKPVIQMTLLDPFMPVSVPLVLETPLGASVMDDFDEKLDTLDDTGRLWRLENYFAHDNTSFPTEHVFNWRSPFTNLRVDWTTDTDVDVYNTHDGPILFYADSIDGAEGLPHANVGSPAGIDRLANRRGAGGVVSWGWYHSLFRNEAIFAEGGSPAGVQANIGGSASFTAAARTRRLEYDPLIDYEWSVSKDGGFNWATVTASDGFSGGTTPTINTASVTSAMSGWRFRALAYNDAGGSVSAEATLSIQGAPLVTVHPASSKRIPINTAASISVQATGEGVLSYQWEVSQNGGELWFSVSGGTSPTLSITPTSDSMTGWLYRAKVSNGGGSVFSNACALTVVVPPQITQQPTGDVHTFDRYQSFSVTFTAAASGTAPLTYRWVSLSGGAMSGFAGGANVNQSHPGARSPSLTLTYDSSFPWWNPDSRAYILVVENEAGVARSSPSYIQIRGYPLITGVESDYVFNAEAGAGESFAYDPNIVEDAGQTFLWQGPSGFSSASRTLNVGPLTASNAGYYQLNVSGIHGGLQVYGTLAVLQAPQFVSQPVGQTVALGASITLSASVDGNPAPSFQWRKNNADIPGETLSSFYRQHATLADAGTYSVIVWNSEGFVVSNDAVVVVQSAPVITAHPQSMTVVEGAPVTFMVVAEANPAPDYQWRKNGINIAGATSSSYSIAAASSGDAGNYDVVVSNSLDSVLSTIATLSVNSPPFYTTHPADQTKNVGEPVTFFVTLTAAPGANLQWRRNGVSIPGATGTAYTINNVSTGDAGSYTVFADNGIGTSLSNPGVLTVNVPPAFTLVPGDVTHTSGTAVNWSASATGVPTPTLQWRKDGANLPGATGNSFSIASVALSDAGTYSILASNSAGDVASATWTLTVQAPPAFTTHPESQTIFAGNPVTFTAAATGEPAPTYQWKFNGADIPGATAASYTINSLLVANAGHYECVATNAVGSVTSNTATLTVTAVPVAPVITTHPASRNVLQGQPVSFTVVASGQAPLSYQWRRNGNSIAGATSPNYSIASAASTHAGTYTVVVSNNAGSATSNPGTLTVTAVAGGTGAKLHGIGDLPGGTSLSEVRDATLANGVLHVVGTSNGEGGLDRGIYWTSTDGLSALPDLDGNIGNATPIIASAITPDAAFIASRARKPAVAQRTAVRVATAQLPDAAANLDIGAVFGNSAANTISADGTVLHGFAGANSFRHEIGGAGTVIIPPLPGTFNSSAPAGRGASSDGSVVIGTMSQNGTAASSAAWRYVHGTGVVPLPKLPEGTWNQAVALSPDGRLALLSGNSTAFAAGEFYLYDAVTDHITPLGAPTAAGFPANLGGMTADGSVIGVNRYIRNAAGWHLFETVLIAAGINMTGWAEMGILGVSHDGRLVWGRGSHNGSPEGFIAELPAGFLLTYGAAIAFQAVGDLPGGAVNSEIRDATKVGGLIRAVGNSVDANNQSRAVMWTQGAGLVALPEIVSNPAAQSFVTASAITPDGAFIASRARNTASGPSRTAVRVATAGLTTLDLNAGAIVGASAALAISDNGAILYGLANNNSQVARFTAGGPTATLIAPLPGHNVNDIALDGASADGAVVAGTSYVAGTPTFGAGTIAFRYVHGGGSAPIPFLPGGTRNRAIALSADGVTTMLVGDSTAHPTGEVYLHNASNGTLTALGRPPLGVNNSGGMTSDLSVVGLGKEIRNAHGWHSLRGILANSGVNMAGWTIESILGISRDGRLVYGRGTRGGNPEGFVAEFPQGYLAGWSRPAIVGAWTVGDPTQDGATVVVFTDEGRYFHIQNATPEEESSGGGTGFERGTYTWNRQSGSLAVTTEFDNNGDIGLSGLNGASGFKFTISGDNATATVPGEGDIPLARVLGPSPIVGAWGLMDSATGGFVVVLLPNGIYFHAEEGTAGEGGMTGIEHGTYTWDSTTGLIASARSPAPFTDTNGEWGLSHPDGDLIVFVSADRSRLIVGDELIPRIGPGDAGPVVTTQPQSAAVNSGGSITLRVTASVLGGSASYQWLLNGAPIPGATGPTYSIGSFSTSNVGIYSVVVSNGTSSTVSRAATLTLGVPRLVNLSARAFAGAGDATLVLGFYIEGTGTKTLLIRGIGPALADYIPDPVVADPALAVYKEQSQIAFNQDWDASLAPDFASVGAFALDPASKDSAMRLTLEPGGYTVHLVNNGPVAEALIEIYDLSKDPGTKLVNLSCRFSFAAGQNVIVGTYLEGAPRTIIARSAGPELGLPPYNITGVLADPKLEMFAGQTSIGSNDDWDAALAAFFGPVGAFPFTTGSKDAATRVTLQPGGYTVHATGNGGSGVAIVELYAEP